MNDTVKHSDGEAIVSLTYTWGMVGGFLLEHGRPATDRNIEALVVACGFDDRIENGMDSLFNGAYDEVEGQLYDAMPENLPDKPWYDRPNGEWVYNREKPADHHDDGEDESWYGTYCHVGNHLNGNQCWLQHLLPMRKAHVRRMHRPLLHMRQHRLRRRRTRKFRRRMGMRRVRTRTQSREEASVRRPRRIQGHEAIRGDRYHPPCHPDFINSL